jgi:opacity protein-like surface antigen
MKELITMFTRAALLASCLALTLNSTSVFAADIYAPSAGGLKDPVIEEQVFLPAPQVYQEFAEWYVRGDFGVGRFGTMNGKGDAEGTPFAVDGLSFETIYSGSVGFGRYATPHVRLGLDVEYRHQSSSKFNTGNPSSVRELTNLGTIPLELTTTSVMFNAVYDFSPRRRFSPYVGGGIGWAFHTLDLNGSSYTNADGTGTVNVDSSSSNSFAANVVTGVSFNIRQGLYLDMGYKFSYLGDAEMHFSYTHPGALPDPDPTIELSDIMTHEFKIGLRYDLY